MSKKQSLLENFIGEHVLIILSGLEHTIQEENGIMQGPLLAQGMILDVDDDFVLLGGDGENMSLVSIGHIGKIDTTDGNIEDIVNKPPKVDMN